MDIYIWLINYILLLFSIGLFIVIVILYIVRLHNDSYRVVRRMIEGIRFCGCTFSYFLEKGERQIFELARMMSESMTMFREKLCETDVKCQYYETLLCMTDSGIWVSDAERNIGWMNQAAFSYINKSSLRHIDELGSLNPEFPEILNLLKNGEVKVLHILSEDMAAFWAVTVICYISKRKELCLINLKNIRSVLE